jgi:hypothetical protein
MRAPGNREGRSVKRFARGGFIADVITKNNDDRDIFHWVLQREDSKDVLEIGQERTLAAAEKEAKERLAFMAKRWKQQEQAS